MSELRIDNFRLGQRADGALRDDSLLSARSLKNFDVIYSDGRLRVRKGYATFNAVALAGAPTQLYHFRPMSDPDKNHVMCIADGNWYVAKATGSHTQLSTEEATAPRPIVEYGDRVFFGTDGAGSDIGFRWTDGTAIGTATSYRVGIAKPTVPPTLVETTPLGVTATPILGSRIELNATTQQKFASPFTLTETTRFGSIWMCLSRRQNTSLEGNIRIKIYTDDSGEPSTTLAHDDAISWEWPVQNLAVNFLGGIDDNTKRFAFPATIELAAGDYWAVLEADDTYRTNFITANFNVEIHYDQPGSPTWGGSKWWNNNTSAWDATNYEPHMFIGGFDETKYYDYIYTYVNSRYQIESRPSSPARLKASNTPGAMTVNHSATSEAQVDKIRYYRREVDNSDDRDEDITDTYKFVFEVAESDPYTDNQYTDELGAEIQTYDHYLFDETDDGDEDIRTAALQPNVATVWKDRIWFAEADDNNLYFSKILEENGRTGLIGDAIPDFFPLENRLEMPVPSGVIALRAISDDMMAVYFQDESIWVVWGANETLNPPPDIAIDDKTPANGLIAPMGIDRMEGSHLIMTRDGLYAFHPTGRLEFLSETNQSIIDAIETAYLESSVITVYGEEIWCLIDDDNDGNLETILILDMQRDIQTRQLLDRAWRTYGYGVNLNDIIVRKSGSTFRTLLAASADTAYIFELNTGTLDDASPIVAEVETHDLRLPERVLIYGGGIHGNYVSVPPSYEVLLTDHLGNTHAYELYPSSSDDVRGHRFGCRMVSAPQARARISMSSVNADELLGLVIYFGGRV